MNTESEIVTGKIRAANAFYYYEKLEEAWAFYRDILGLETVVDYGFAKMMRVAHASYLTLVDAESGMHDVAEPKSVTLAMVTEQVAEWYDYLTASDVPMHRDLDFRAGSAHDGFVALDPEGYFLEFERFNPHPENVRLMPLLSELETTHTSLGSRPPELGIQATVLWLYYRGLSSAQQFLEDLLNIELLVDQGWAKVYPLVGSSFLGFVDGDHGLHKATDKKCVTVSLFTDDLDRWYQRAAGWEGFSLITPEIKHESQGVRLFVGTDPEGYYFEWDTFQETGQHSELLRQLRQQHN